MYTYLYSISSRNLHIRKCILAEQKLPLYATAVFIRSTQELAEPHWYNWMKTSKFELFKTFYEMYEIYEIIYYVGNFR